jgi:hypothetical protein
VQGRGTTSFFCMDLPSFSSVVYWKGSFLIKCGTLSKLIWPWTFEFILGFSILYHFLSLCQSLLHCFDNNSFIILSLESGMWVLQVFSSCWWNPPNTVWKSGEDEGVNRNTMEGVNLFEVHMYRITTMKVSPHIIDVYWLKYDNKNILVTLSSLYSYVNSRISLNIVFHFLIKYCCTGDTLWHL